MNIRWLIGALGILAVAALLARGAGRGAAWPPFPPAARAPVRARAPSPPSPPPARRTPSRNLFEYAEEGAAAAPRLPPLHETYAAPSAPAPSPSPAVRLAGLIRRGGEVKAALVVEGELTVAGKGDRAGGYTVLDVDDETGVRLRGPGGEETLLPPPPF